jgi:hypothetical protein
MRRDRRGFCGGVRGGRSDFEKISGNRRFIGRRLSEIYQTALAITSFMGLPRALPMPLDVDFKLKGIVHGFHINGAEELILHFVRQTAAMGRTPAQFKFHSGSAIEIRANQIYIPATLIGGLVGIVIFQPANKNQTVPEKYWINVSDFKMFVSEFWGRIDLAERIMNFYLH